MKKRMKHLALLLVLALIAGVFAGCGNAENEPVETEPQVTVPVVYDSYYYFYDYGVGEYRQSNVATYQAVTGTECELSSLDFAFLEDDYEYVVEGYDEEYGVFLYAYDEALVEAYRNYLITMGYLCTGTEQYTEGFSYYFTNETNGFMMDIFVASDESYVAIEPYLNSNPDGAGGEISATEEPFIPAETEAPAETGAPVGGGTFYFFYDYETKEYVYSDVSAYQDITGAVCTRSALDWGFLEEGYQDIVSGYDDRYALFIYEYDALQLAEYERYLSSIGYEYAGTEAFTQGTSYYYQNPSNGYFFDLFVANDGEYLVIEPCLNRP